MAPALLAVWTADLEDLHAVGNEEAGEAGAIGTGTLDTSYPEISVGVSPAEELMVSSGGSRYGKGSKEPANVVKQGTDVDVSMGIYSQGHDDSQDTPFG